jgi:lipopolysaccharide biosynthesis glycosyltransferase
MQNSYCSNENGTICYEQNAGDVTSKVMNRCVVFACDEAYAMPLATAIVSLVEAYSGSRPLDLYVLFDRFADVTRQKVAQPVPEWKAVIHWTPIDLAEFKHFSTLPYTSKMTYARLRIPELLPYGISRALYLDADVLVLDDIEKIFELDLKGSILGAVVDGLDSQMKLSRDFERVPRVRDYFNAGVLLMNLDLWREERISERALQYLSDYPQSIYADQDALNVVCDSLWMKLEPRWNYQECWINNIAKLHGSMRPGIVHFATAEKPWHAGINHINSGFYDSFRRRTRFARSVMNRVSDRGLDAWYSMKCILKMFLPRSFYKQTRQA